MNARHDTKKISGAASLTSNALPPSLSGVASVAKHTPGPWSIDDTEGLFIVADDVEGLIAEITSNGQSAGEVRANAARIVACVNACEGIPDPMKLRACMDEAEDHARSCQGVAVRSVLEWDSLLEQNRVLRRYARHNEFCNEVANGIDGDCPCGLNATLAKSQGEFKEAE